MAPGYKSTEFWMSLASMLVGLLLSSGAISVGSGFDKALGIVASILASLGYSISRGLAKSGS